MLNFIKNLFERTPRLTKVEIINETIEFYSADTTRRSVNPKSKLGCSYNYENGNHCAVGRVMLPKYQKRGTKLKGNTATVGTLLEELKIKKIDNILQPQYRGHDIRFWRKLQILHDRSHYWQENGLTDVGLDYANELLETYKSNSNETEI